MEVPESLSAQIYVDLFSSITEQYPVPTRRLDVWRLEAVYHKTMLESSNACFGREVKYQYSYISYMCTVHVTRSYTTKYTNHKKDLLSDVLRLLQDEQTQKPVIVIGQPGSGKTTVTCAAIGRLVEEDARGDILLFYHIVAASAQSFSLQNLLQRLCRCLKRKAKLKIELPSSLQALKDTWIHFAIMASKLKRVVIVLDAINQLSPDHGAWELSWIPHVLPNANVKVLCTMIKGDLTHKRFEQRGSHRPDIIEVCFVRWPLPLRTVDLPLTYR